ncbi:prefoldin subunit 1 isoform X1 [Hypomesus transpacificus]|uniref:prefoldin subunit 1 isoform X1 n=1 Tax=Hypomesus transpacificus TaxID=137520 RepID=UPI001F083A6E|nr:prefoldin subunit 1 isoform X1 [Hypomesus transpacificus]
MAAPIDLELKKAFAELQAKMIDTQQKAKLADLQIDQLTRMKKHANLTHTEIASLPGTTRMYEGVGRMFILQSKEEINTQLTDKQKTSDEKIKELESNNGPRDVSGSSLCGLAPASQKAADADDIQGPS